MAKYFTTYCLKGKYTEYEPMSENMLSSINIAQRGTQLADFFSFTEALIKKKKVNLVLVIVDSSFSPVSFAGLEEISLQIEKMHNHDINVYFYAPSYNMSTLYLSASAEKTFIHPIGNVCFGGFYKRSISAATLLSKIGIRFDTTKTGQLKDTFAALGDSVPDNSFTKMLLKDYEDAFVLQTEKKWAVKGLYRNLLDEQIFSASEAKEIGFADEIAALPEVLDRITKKGFQSRKIKTPFTSPKKTLGKKIAIVFVNGELIDGSEATLFNTIKRTVSSNKMIGIINRLKRKRSIEAVLFRIDSTGGSSNAGYDLYQAVKKLSEQKLTVISIGNYATSAAYWMALGGKVIFANSTSVIGSVGATTTRPYVLEALEKMGIQVAMEKLEDANTIGFFEECGEMVKTKTEIWLAEIMSNFLNAINTHCTIDDETLEIIESGCSFSGSYAWKHGLVDQIGGIDQALEYIRTQIGSSLIKYEYYPEHKKSFFYRKLLRMVSK